MYRFALSLTSCNPSLSLLANIAWNQLVIPAGLNGHKGEQFLIEDAKKEGKKGLGGESLVVLGILRDF